MSAEATQQPARSGSGTSPAVGRRRAGTAPRARHGLRRPSHTPERRGIVPPPAPEASVPEAGRRIEVERVEPFVGAGLLVSDVRTALLLVNEARYRTIQGLFGVPREDVNLITLIATLALAGVVDEKLERLRAGWSPSRSDAMIGIGALNALGDGIAGPAGSKVPFAGLVVGSAVVASVSGRALKRSTRAMKASAHQLGASFGHRYFRRSANARPPRQQVEQTASGPRPPA